MVKKESQRVGSKILTPEEVEKREEIVTSLIQVLSPLVDACIYEEGAFTEKELADGITIKVIDGDLEDHLLVIKEIGLPITNIIDY